MNIRKEWPTVRRYQKHGINYYRVDLRRVGYTGVKTKNFTDKKAALNYATDVAEKVNHSGVKSISTINQDPRLKVWEEQCRIYGKTIDEAFTLAISQFQRDQTIKDSPFMSELLTLWVDDKTTDKLKPLRPRSAKTIRGMGNIFKQDFGETRIKEINQDRIEKYLSDKDVSNQTRKNLRSYLGQFFNYCVRKNYHHENPVEKIQIQVVKDAPKFFTVEQSKQIMEKAKAHGMVGYYSLCLFQGIRPEETEKLTWENIKMDTKEIIIPASIAKTKRDRVFRMEDNLFLWLKSVEDKPLLPSNWRKAKRTVVKELGFWEQDAMRRSFATFHYAKHKSIEELRAIMGNSPNIIDRCYKGAIPAADVEKFWGIVPKNV